MTNTTPTEEERAALEEARAFTQGCEAIELYLLKHFGVHLSLRPRNAGVTLHVSGSDLTFTSGVQGESSGQLAITLKIGRTP